MDCLEVCTSVAALSWFLCSGMGITFAPIHHLLIIRCLCDWYVVSFWAVATQKGTEELTSSDLQNVSMFPVV